MMVASQAEDPKLYVAHTRSQQHRLKIQQLCVHHSRSQHPPFALWWGGLRKTGRVCLSGDKYAFSVKPSDGELLNQLVFLDSLLTQFPCPLLMVGLGMPTGYVLSGTNSPQRYLYTKKLLKIKRVPWRWRYWGAMMAKWQYCLHMCRLYESVFSKMLKHLHRMIVCLKFFEEDQIFRNTPHVKRLFNDGAALHINFYCLDIYQFLDRIWICINIVDFDILGWACCHKVVASCVPPGFTYHLVVLRP